jgi:hypothetical protein
MLEKGLVRSCSQLSKATCLSHSNIDHDDNLNTNETDLLSQLLHDERVMSIVLKSLLGM